MQQKRRLAAILFTDIVGSTAIMQKDEQAALLLNKRYISVLKQSVSLHDGEILNDYGDGSLCTFHSATEALRCAVEIQKELQSEPKVPLRIGLHVGEIFFEDGKVFGDGVNVASRVQSLGIANSILFSSEINSKIRNQPEFTSTSLGKFDFKNVNEPVEVFALANEGFAIPDKKKIEGKLKEKSNKRKLIIIASIIIAALALLFIYKKNTAEIFSDEDKSIAILPFDVSGNNEDNLALGLAEDILIHLSKIREFDKVISNKSSSQYKDTKKSLKEIGLELGAVFLVTGRIEESKDKIRVSAQLIDSRNGKTIWADDYTKRNVEIFDLQTELATQIVSALKTEITSDEKTGLSRHYTENIEAYKFYRKGRWFWDKRTKESFDSAEIYYNKAINLDPDYALAYSGLADLYIFPNSGMLQTEAIPVAKQYLTKALLLDSTLSEALTTLGFIQSVYDYNWIASKATLEKAVSYNPNYPTAHLYYGNLLQYTGESMQKGLAEIKRALSLDPLFTNLNYVLGRNYYFARKYDSAYTQLKKTLTLNPDFNLAKGNLAYVCLARKNYAEAFGIIKQIEVTGLPKIYYYRSAVLSYAYAVTGNKANAKTELDKSIAQYPEQSTYHLSCVYFLLNDYDKGFALLEKAYSERDLWLYCIKVDPAFDAVRNDPRFKAFLKKLNFK